MNASITYMKSITVKLLIGTFLLSLSACYLDDSSGTPIQPLPYLQIEGLFDSLRVDIQLLEFDPSSAASLTGDGGTSLIIPEGAFQNSSGDMVLSGTVDIELREVLTKSQMVLSNIPTTAGGLLLESGGALYLSATQNGSPLSLAKPLEARWNVSSAIAAPAEMQIFYASNFLDGNDWQEASDGSEVIFDNQTDPPQYHLLFEELDWINCDRFYNSSGPTTNVSLTPFGYSTTLSDGAGFLVFKNLNAVMRMQYSDEKLTAANVPVGEEVTMVMLAMNRGDLFYGSKLVTIDMDLNEEVKLDRLSQNEIRMEILNLQ